MGKTNGQYNLLTNLNPNFMKTELIASWKLVNANNREMYIVTTISGSVVWVPKAQFDTNAEQITYTMLKAGSDYTNSAGDKAQLKADRNEFNGCGKQVVKKYSTLEILDHLANKGVTPTFALS